jgi:hypothetical protein
MWDISQSKQSIKGSSHDQLVDAKLSDSDAHFDSLEKQVKHLTLACEAMWTLLQEKHELPNELLHDRMIEIEEQHKVSADLVECDDCNRKYKAALKRCVYCGTANSHQSVF